MLGARTTTAGDARELRKTLGRLAAVACLVVVAVLVAGWLWGRARHGTSDAAVLDRVRAEVLDRFEIYQRELEGLVTGLAARQGELSVPPADERATRELFQIVEAALGDGNLSNLAVTIYGPAGPVAWGGRPSELPPDRIGGPRANFVAPGPLGPRLVHVEPVVDGSGDRRTATIVGERILGMAEGTRPTIIGEFTFDTSLVPVALRTRYEGAGEALDPFSFVIPGPDGEPLLQGRVRPQDLAAARRAWWRRVTRWALVAAAVGLGLLCGPLLWFLQRSRDRSSYLSALTAIVGALSGARLLLWLAVPRDAPPGSMFSADTYSSSVAPGLLHSPIDFLLTSMLLAAFVALAGHALERRRVARARTGRTRRAAGFLVIQLVAGAGLVGLLVLYQQFLQDLLANSSVDILRFSVYQWNPARLAMVAGLVLSAAAVVWGAVLLLRHGTPEARPSSVHALRFIGAAGALGATYVAGGHVPVAPTAWSAAACLVAAGLSRQALLRFRHGSQGMRLVSRLLLLVIPSVLIYPTLFHFADEAKQELVATRFASQVVSQRAELQNRLRRALEQIDEMPQLGDLVEAAAGSGDESVSTDAAFAVWSLTDLAAYRLTSAVELYGPDGRLVSRFALNLPEDTSLEQWNEPSCAWDVYAEVSPFGAQERRILHAGRNLCFVSPGPDPATQTAGTVVVHAMLDYNTLPFISSQSPYFELFRTAQPALSEGVPGRDLEFVVYGWSRRPVYTSTGSAWPLGDTLFSRIWASRDPFWAYLDARGTRYAVYFLNEREGIYALGYRRVSPFGHLVSVAELVALAGVVYAALLGGAWIFSIAGRYGAASGRALLREIRASFYRKLFLAFVAAGVVPVLSLAFLTRAYIAGQLLDGIESAAVRTVAVARRVVEDYATQQQRGSLPLLADDVMVWISRVIDQDVNIFEGPRLQATSERDLFASGLLPTRTPASVYRAIVLDHLPSVVGNERVGTFQYLLAAAPVRSGNREAILTVPMTLRQQEIEREIDELNRRVVLAVLVFILFGALIGYSMAERIADPVNRLTRATRRIARGDLDARIAATSSDEFRRLVEAFNGMAAELARQRVQLERTHRLEAWAEMARQVAHEIKNPLTPIQLSAEHLQRVNVDRGRPLSPVLDDCVGAVLMQVRLLREIAAEFSSFASSPTARPAAIPLADLATEVIEPYRVGLGGRITIRLELPADLPPVYVDRILVVRALTNVIENSLHAMPGAGGLTMAAVADHGRGRVVLTVSDTGVGMDEEDQRHIFEPYFSTKSTGTGLGLTIAKRNIELVGGTIGVRSEKGRGTTVTIELPIAG